MSRERDVVIQQQVIQDQDVRDLGVSLRKVNFTLFWKLKLNVDFEAFDSKHGQWATKSANILASIELANSASFTYAS